MLKNNSILDELREISPMVADLDADHPYVTPVGYFELLAERIMELIKTTPEAHFPLLSKKGKLDDPFSVPDEYFNQLAGNIMSRVQNEGLSAAEEIEKLSPVLGQLDKKLPFSIPEGYFQDMPSNVVAGIKAIDFVEAELEIMATPLLAIKHINVYTVPQNYFDLLPAQIIQKIKPKAKLLGMNLASRVVRFAAAAAIIGVMVIGLLVFNRDNDTNIAVTATSAGLDSNIANISDADIINYLNNSTVTMPEPVSATGSDMKEEDMKDMLANVTDKDIEMYLEDYGISKEELTN